MVSCAFCGRTKNEKSKLSKTTFHRIPIEETQRKNWLEFGLKWYAVSPVNKNAVICSTHFEKNCFNLYNKSVQMKPNVVPTVVVQRVQHARQVYPENIISTSTKSCTSANTIPLLQESYMGLSHDHNYSIQINNARVTGSKLHKSDLSKSKDDNETTSITNEKEIDLSFILTNKQMNHYNKIIFKTDRVNKNDPTCQYLKRRIMTLLNANSIKAKKIKSLQQTIKYQKRKILSLKNEIESLTE